MTKAYECLECSFECYNLSVAKKHLERTNHQVVPAGQKNIVEEVKEVKEPTDENNMMLRIARLIEQMNNLPPAKVKDSREDWEPGIMVTRRSYGYEVSHWGAAIGIYDTLSEAQDGIATWTDHADTCETCSDGFPGAASHV
jgi:hypothetical protein